MTVGLELVLASKVTFLVFQMTIGLDVVFALKVTFTLPLEI